MLTSILYVVLGFILLIWSADRLVIGASATARNLGISPLVIGLTIVGFGTSSPEMVVSAIAALQGTPGLAVGNAVGSNIANIGLVLGLTALLSPLLVHSNTLKREYPVLIIATLGTLFLLLDHHLSRMDGIILIVALLGITIWFVHVGMQENENSAGQDPMAEEYDAEIPKDMPSSRALISLFIGLAVLPLSSQILVIGASDIAQQLGVSDILIGLTVVALGTSLPELAAAISSAVKKEDDIAVGNILGSNLFNLLGVLGIAGILSPLEINETLLQRDYALMFLMTLLLVFVSLGFRSKCKISRRSGLVLLTIYVSYQSWLIYSTLQAAKLGA